MLSVIITPSIIERLSDMEVNPDFITFILGSLVLGSAILFWVGLLWKVISWLISLFKK